VALVAAALGTVLGSSRVRAHGWPEIYNAEPISIDIGGMYFTDDLTFPRKFPIPSGITAPADGHVLLWTGNQACRLPGGVCQPNDSLICAYSGGLAQGSGSARSTTSCPRCVADEDCSKADFDGDYDVDQVDFGIFQRCCRGKNNPADAGWAD